MLAGFVIEVEVCFSPASKKTEPCGIRAVTPLNLAMALKASIASSSRPCASNQAGDSGMKMSAKMFAKTARMAIRIMSGIQSRLIVNRYTLKTNIVAESKLVIVTEVDAVFLGGTNSVM